MPQRTHPLPSHIWKLVGTQPGPIVVIMGGTHGDERTGVKLVQELLERLGLSGTTRATIDGVPNLQGTLFLIIGNPEAVEQDIRGISIRRNLNRCFVPEWIGNDDALPEDESGPWPDLIRARELAPILAEADYVFDFHAVDNEDEDPFLCYRRPTEKRAKFTRLAEVDIIVTDVYNRLGTDAGSRNTPTTDEWTDLHGGIGICYETGYQRDESRLPAARRTLGRWLYMVGFSETFLSCQLGLELTVMSPREQRAYALDVVYQARADQEVSKEGFFFYEPGICHEFVPVQAGDLIGRYRDGEEVHAEKTGVMIFPTPPGHRQKPGETLFFIGTEISLDPAEHQDA